MLQAVAVVSLARPIVLVQPPISSSAYQLVTGFFAASGDLPAVLGSTAVLPERSEAIGAIVLKSEIESDFVGRTGG